MQWGNARFQLSTYLARILLMFSASFSCNDLSPSILSRAFCITSCCGEKQMMIIQSVNWFILSRESMHVTCRSTYRKSFINNLFRLGFSTDATDSCGRSARTTGSTLSTASLPGCVPEGKGEILSCIRHKQNKSKSQIPYKPTTNTEQKNPLSIILADIRPRGCFVRIRFSCFIIYLFMYFNLVLKATVG